MNLKKTILELHIWLGLTSGTIIFIVALTDGFILNGGVKIKL